MASLACFTELGFEKTTVEEIRRRSGASVGSIYHHFGGKENLAAALYLEGIVDHQEGLAAKLEGAEDARAGVEAVVRFHLGWIRDNPEWARFLFHRRDADYMAAAEKEIDQRNAVFRERLQAWIGRMVKRGEIRRLPPDIYLSLIIGPAHSYGKRWIAGGTAIEMDEAAGLFAEAAWRSLKS